MILFAELPGPSWGLIGVALGWFLNAVMDAIRRRWQRNDKTQDLALSRGEELLQQCYEVFQWSEDARKCAFDGEFYVPIPTSVLRAAGIVELYYPALSERAKALDKAAREYRAVLVDIAAKKSTAKPLPQDATQRLQSTQEALYKCNILLLNDARERVRSVIEKDRK